MSSALVAQVDCQGTFEGPAGKLVTHQIKVGLSKKLSSTRVRRELRYSTLAGKLPSR